MRRAKALSAAESAAARRGLVALAHRGELSWADAVVRMRLSLGVTQEEFGRLFGLGRRQVLDLEAGRANPTVETLDRIGRAFGLAVGFVPLPGPPSLP